MSTEPASRPLSQAIWLPLLLMIAALAMRVLAQENVITGWPNLSPMMAFAFVGSILFPRQFPWWSLVIALLLVDWICDGASYWKLTQGRPEILLSYGCYALAAWWGSRLRGSAGVVDALLGTLACSLLFYLVTNTLCWWIEPYYAKNLTGWTQALTTGLPGLPPTWTFFRNSLIADLGGASVLLAVYNAEALMRRLHLLPWKAGRQTLAAA